MKLSRFYLLIAGKGLKNRSSAFGVWAAVGQGVLLALVTPPRGRQPDHELSLCTFHRDQSHLQGDLPTKKGSEPRIFLAHKVNLFYQALPRILHSNSGCLWNSIF